MMLREYVEEQVFEESVKLAMHDRSEDRCFVNNPADWEKLSRSYDDEHEIRDLITEIADSFHLMTLPSRPPFFHFPKRKKGTRLTPILSLRNEILYNAIVLSLLDYTNGKVIWKYSRSTYEKFMVDSKALCEQYSVAKKVDLKNFFNEINHSKLENKLLADNKRLKYVSILMKCLKTYSIYEEKGIPVGYSASDALANYFLKDILTYLDTNNIVYTQFMDDFILFENDVNNLEDNYRRFIHKINEHGLTINEEKTTLFDTCDEEFVILKQFNYPMAIRTICKTSLNDTIHDFIDKYPYQIKEYLELAKRHREDFDKFMDDIIQYLTSYPHRNYYQKYCLLDWALTNDYLFGSVIKWVQSLLKDTENPPYVHWIAQAILKKWKKSHESLFI